MIGVLLSPNVTSVAGAKVVGRVDEVTVIMPESTFSPEEVKSACPATSILQFA